MEPMDTLTEIEARAQAYTGVWGANHSKRLMRLAEKAAAGRGYDAGVLSLAAWLHDWGAYSPWVKAGEDHALRSAEVIPGVLAVYAMSDGVVAHVVECARLHHHCDASASTEAILLHDADALDFLGVTGVLRNCSRLPKDLRAALAKTRERMQYAGEHLILDSSRALAEPLVERMERLMADFQQETGGCF